jgi:hypothetical protein
MIDTGCICKGNWREIIKENQQDFGKLFNDRNGNIHKYIGVVHTEDDYYHLLYDMNGKPSLISCAVNLDMIGYEPVINK